MGCERVYRPACGCVCVHLSVGDFFFWVVMAVVMVFVLVSVRVRVCFVCARVCVRAHEVGLLNVHKR